MIKFPPKNINIPPNKSTFHQKIEIQLNKYFFNQVILNFSNLNNLSTKKIKISTKTLKFPKLFY